MRGIDRRGARRFPFSPERSQWTRRDFGTSCCSGSRTAPATPKFDEIARRFGALAGEIPGIEGFEWGANSSPEGKAGGHSHCFMLTFVSEAARDGYLPHPKHIEFVAFASEWIERPVVFDYLARSAGS